MMVQASGHKMITLTNEEKKNLYRFIEPFKRYLESPLGRKEDEQRKGQVDFFQEELPSRLPELAETDVAEIVNRLWSTQMWGNKQYLAQELINSNSLEGIASGLQILLDKSRSPTQRYEEGLGKVRGLGPASITEILCYADPNKFAIWNRRAREALTLLKFTRFVSPKKYKLTTHEYERFNDLSKAIAAELQNADIQADLLTVDYFLYEVGNQAPNEGHLVAAELAAESHFDHDEIRDIVKGIGALLGFDVETEVKVAHGARVDVVWRARIGNLGRVTYVFEVHKGGTIDSLLLNLQKARSAATVQKVIAISDQKLLDSIVKECEGLPEEFRKTLAYWPVNDVLEVSKSLIVANELISKLGLVPVI